MDKTRSIISAEFNSSSTANGFYSGYGPANALITMNALSNLVLKTTAGDQYSIVTKIGNLPRPLFMDILDEVMHKVSNVGKLTLFIPMFFNAVALFVKHPLMENTTKIKQLQRMAGVPYFMYWGTIFIIDYAFYIIITLFLILGIFLTDFFGESDAIPLTECGKLNDILILIMNREIGSNIQVPFSGILLLLFLLFGMNVLLLAYVHSFIKKRYSIVGLISSLAPTLICEFIMARS